MISQIYFATITEVSNLTIIDGYVVDVVTNAQAIASCLRLLFF